MSCAQCDKDAAVEDYFCEDCRSALEGCTHKDRQKAISGLSPSHHEMEVVLEERVFFGPLLPRFGRYCQCCGTVHLLHEKRCLHCIFYEEFPHGPDDYKNQQFVYQFSKTYDLCPQCKDNPLREYDGAICTDCEYLNSLCKECYKVPALKDDTLCHECRFWTDAQNAQGEIVIYHGMQYKGNILACKVMGSDPREGMKLALPPQFAKRESFITKEEMHTCVKCGKLYINHWAAEPEHYPDECAPCAGVRVFPWAACILEWDQAPLDKTASSV